MDDDLETKINQLLASGVVSNIVNGGFVYLTRTSKKRQYNKIDFKKRKLSCILQLYSLIAPLLAEDTIFR